jgi:hypothetical protein
MSDMAHVDGPTDLIRLSDDDSSLRVCVLGRRRPGVLPLHDLLDAEILVETSFIRGRLSICFYPANLEEWSRCLAALRAGQDVEWLNQGNGPMIRVEWPEDNGEIVLIHVQDATGSGASASIPIVLESDWIQQHQELLDTVRQTWPSEVLVTSPGAYEWNRG